MSKERERDEDKGNAFPDNTDAKKTEKQAPGRTDERKREAANPDRKPLAR